jgi:hypothetical protein
MASDMKKFQSRRGLARYPSVTREEIIKNKPTGNFACSIELSGEALEHARGEIEDFISETFPAKKAKGVNRPFKEKDGKVFLKFTTKCRTKEGEAKSVRIFDSKGNRCDHVGKLLGHGSTIRIKGSLAATEYQGGDYVKCFLDSVEVVKLVKYEPGGGFDKDPDATEDEDGGFVADEFGDGGGSSSPDDEDGQDEAPAQKAPPAKGSGKQGDF